MPWRTAQVIDVHRFVKMSLFWLWIVVKVLSYYIYNMGFDQHISKKKHLTKAKPPRISDQGFLVKYGYDSIQQKTHVRLLATRDTLKVTTKVSEQKSLYPPEKIEENPATNNSAMLVQMFTANGVLCQKNIGR